MPWPLILQIALCWLILSVLFGLALGRVFAAADDAGGDDTLLLTENDMEDSRVVAVLAGRPEEEGATGNKTKALGTLCSHREQG